MKVALDEYPGWREHPVYTITKYTQEEANELFRWCYQMQVDTFSLAFGSRSHTFQVKTNHELFVLQWL